MDATQAREGNETNTKWDDYYKQWNDATQAREGIETQLMTMLQSIFKMQLKPVRALKRFYV